MDGSKQNLAFSTARWCSSVDTKKDKAPTVATPRCRLTTFLGFHGELQPLSNQPAAAAPCVPQERNWPFDIDKVNNKSLRSNRLGG